MSIFRERFMILHRGLVVMAALGLGWAIVGGAAAARADRVAWLDETWTVVEHTSTFDQATTELWFGDTYAGFRAEIPVDPAFDLITDWGDLDAPILRFHSATATLSRAFEVVGPGTGPVSLFASLLLFGESLPWLQELHAHLEIAIPSHGGTRVASVRLEAVNAGYGPAHVEKYDQLDLALDPGAYTFRVEASTWYQRWRTEYSGVPWVVGHAEVGIAGIEPPAGVVIPEPSSLALAVVGALAVCLGRHGRRGAWNKGGLT